MKVAFIVTIVSLLPSFGTVSGYVHNKKTEEPLVGVNVVILGTELGACTDQRGFFNIHNIPEGEYEIEATMIGYQGERKRVSVVAGRKVEVSFRIAERPISLSPVVVTAERLIEKTSVSAQSLGGDQLIDLQGIVEDPLRSLQSLPGISGGEEFTSWLCVRGGAPKENLWLLDWVPVYWPFHFGGMKSVFNAEMVDKIELYTGGFPPKYGNALSSVVNVSTRDGSMRRLKGKVNLSLINALGLLEIPLMVNSSCIVSGRRSYYDLVLRNEEDFVIPSFYDLQTKIRYDLSESQKLYLSGLLSGEEMEVEFEDPEPGQPTKLVDQYTVSTSSLEWKWLINPRVYSMLAFIFQTADVRFEMDRWWMDGLAIEPGIREDLTIQVGDVHEFKTGFEIRRPDLDWVSFIPIVMTQEAWTDTNIQAYKRVAKGAYWFGGGYIQDSWDILPGLVATFGLRVDYLNYTDKWDFSPRFSVKYDLDLLTSVRAAWGHYHQIPELEELIENSHLDTRLSKHYIIGLERRISEPIRSWIEVYEKRYDNLVSVDSSGHYENNGYGFARGVEFFIQKKTGPLSGWISYALSWAKRKEYLDEEELWFDYDQRHHINVVFDYNLGKGWKIGGKWRLVTGRPYTPVIAGVQDTSGNWIAIYGETKSERNPIYHRLDLKLDKDFSFLGTESSIYVEVLNAYYRKNVQGYTYTFTPDGEPIPDPYYGLPILPSVGLSVQF